jgi:hypothetical protein
MEGPQKCLPDVRLSEPLFCSILDVLVFIHATPLNAQDSGSGSSSGTTGEPVQDMSTSVSGPTIFSSSGAATYSVTIVVPKGDAEFFLILRLHRITFKAIRG